jgi:hypothetical protein
MPLYLGNQQVKINLNGAIYKLNDTFIIAPSEIRDDVLVSSDGFILKDCNGLYLIPKSEIEGTVLLTSDGSILTDSSGFYLTFKEG